MLRIASRDGRGSKLEKAGTSVSSFDAMPANCKNHQKKILRLVLPNEICLVSSSLLNRSICV